MKYLIFFLFVGIFQAMASDGYSQTAKLTLDMQDATVAQVISQIENISHFYFTYNTREINPNRKVSVHLEEDDINAAMKQLFGDENVNFIISDKHVVLYKGSAQTEQNSQQIPVTGKVTDAAGELLIGTSVKIKGTTQGTITDANGAYSLPVQDENAVLVFSFLGYVTQEIVVGSRRSINVILNEATRDIDEVVVVGYGTTKKANLTGAVASIKFDDEMLNRPITNASQALSGKASGIWVSQNSGKPGDDGALLRIRGWGTLNNSDPLIIIDGVESGFGQINPNDIESISILKDAASAAIYGSKAANGVILVTTKMGQRHEKTEVNFLSYAGIQTLGRKFDLINNSVESMTISNRANANDGKGPVYPDYLVKSFEDGADPYKYPNTDWFNLMFEPSAMYEANLSIKGGTQKSSSYLSFNYMNQDGLLPHTQSYRYGIRANTEYDINNWLKVGGRFNYIRRISDEPYDLARTFEMIRGTTPFIAPYTRDGQFGSSEAINNQGVQLYDNRNALIDAANGNRRATTDLITANAFVQMDFTKDLFLRATWSSTGRWNLIDRYNTPGFGYTDSGMETITKNYNREGLEMIRNFDDISMTNNFYTTLNYNKTFAGIHDVSAIAGLQAEDYNQKTLRARRSNPPKSGLTQVDAGTGGIQGEGNMVGLRMFSYFGRINYAFMQKYLFEVNFRADASSRFKEGNRWGYFPGFSAGWRLSEEDMIKNLGLFSNLKLRASWGQLGNQNIAGYWPYLPVFTQNNSLSYSYNGTLSPGAAVTEMVEPGITWETTTTLDFGIDIGLFNNQLNIEADYFRKKTSDIIVQLPIPSILGGISAPYENVGEMLNKGVELTINYDSKPANNNRFGYNIGLNFTYVDNKVTKFRKDAPDQLYLIRDGYSYRTLYGYKAIGVYQSDEEAKSHMYANGFNPKAGHLKFEDVNEDGKLDYLDKQELGNTIPKITYGLTTKFSYRNFDLSMLLQGVMIGNLYTQSQYTIMDYDNQTITTKWRDAWTPENTNTNIPAVRFGSTWDNSENSFWVHRSDFLKLKNIQFGYMLPQAVSSKIGMGKMYVYANAQNVFTLMMFKGYEGFDPERAYNGDGAGLYPVARVVSFGINLNF